MIGALGKEVILTVNSWAGPLPSPGSYIKSKRGRTAYEIVEFRPSKPGSKTVGRLVCVRMEASELPEWATVHSWVWAKRQRAARTTRVRRSRQSKWKLNKREVGTE